MSLAIYPGSFDPLTNGHLDVALRAARLFDTLIIGIYEGSNKPGAMFDIPERVKLARMAIAESGHPFAERIRVERFSGLAVTYAREKGAAALVRGLRAVSDFEYEFQLASMNRHLIPEVETLFLTPAEQYGFISSTLVREISRLGGDVSGFVPAAVDRALRKLSQR